jgi:hypothetical protein
MMVRDTSKLVGGRADTFERSMATLYVKNILNEVKTTFLMEMTSCWRTQPLFYRNMPRVALSVSTSYARGNQKSTTSITAAVKRGPQITETAIPPSTMEVNL